MSFYADSGLGDVLV